MSTILVIADHAYILLLIQFFVVSKEKFYLLVTPSYVYTSHAVCSHIVNGSREADEHFVRQIHPKSEWIWR